MTATFQAASGEKEASSVTSHSLTGPSGGGTAGRMLIVQLTMAGGGGATITGSVTCNGNAMTSGGSFTTNLAAPSYLYYIAGDSNVSSGANTIACTTTVNEKIAFNAAVWNGVDSATPISSIGTESAYNISPFGTVSVTSSATNVIACLMSVLGGGNAPTVVMTATSPATLQYNFNSAVDGNYRFCVLDRAGTGSATIGASANLAIPWDAFYFSIKSGTTGATGRMMTLGVG